MQICGIYRITVRRETVSDAYYIGQSVDIQKRVDSHLSALRNGKSKNVHLQRLYEKYGIDAFTFEVILECARNTVELANCELEVMNLQIRQSGFDNVINMCRETMVSCLGIKRSEETRQRMSASMMGRGPMSEETKRKISETKRLTGFKISDETRAKISEANRGRKMHPNARAALLKALTGIKKPPEEIARRQATRAANKLKEII